MRWPGGLPTGYFHKKNVEDIISLIWKNHWETDEWNNDAIYDDDFKRICRIPFYIPFFAIELLSGEYIIHLLHPDKLKLDYLITCPLKEPLESDDEYRVRCNAEILKRKNDNLLKWLKEFENRLFISFDKIFPDESKRGKKRRGTIGYQLFDEYGYVAYEINKEKGRPQNLLRLYDEPYVNNIEKSVLGQDSYLLEQCDGLVMFKTILLQHVRPQEEGCTDVQRFLIDIQELVRRMVDVKNHFETYLASISEKRKLSSSSEDSKYREQMELAIEWMRGEIQAIPQMIVYDQAELESFPVVMMESDSLFKIIFWRILLLEARAIIQTLKNIFSIPVKSHSEIEKLHQYIRMHPSLSMRVNTWKDFRSLFSEQLNEFFPCYKDNDLKNLWLLAIKTIAYCDPKRLQLPMDIEIPKKLNEKWLKKNRCERLPTGGVLATMLLLENARMYSVEEKEIKIWQDGDLVGSKKVYHHLLPGIPPKDSLTLYQILRNLTREKCTPALLVQVRQLTREYIGGYKLREQELSKSREALKELWDVYDNIVEKATSFDYCRRNAHVFINKLTALADEIKKRKRQT